MRYACEVFGLLYLMLTPHAPCRELQLALHFAHCLPQNAFEHAHNDSLVRAALLIAQLKNHFQSRCPLQLRKWRRAVHRGSSNAVGLDRPISLPLDTSMH